MTKICTKCNKELPIENFYKHNRDGYRSRCKECEHQDNKKYIKKYSRPITERDTISIMKGYARRMLEAAVHGGLIEKPSACSKCNRIIEKNKLHGHHNDYTKPLEIEWLCNDCHKSVPRPQGRVGVGE
jgi:hypothetical protein